MHWKYTKEGIPYLECDSIPTPSSPPPSENFKRMLRDFLQRMKDNNVKVVISKPFLYQKNDN
jgi:hypothetical protein